ncbi:hypothetical protein B0H16DRAFT_1703566 [Mycena metata]|uniref:Uncharacterized protein n=1 Tax=Mycena metata TaxID=1033252 RepID=A0AAD7MDG5_9AGAR|nr:hypothetical protein B0H16DRAFT_1703566 [Mycena metata]
MNECLKLSSSIATCSCNFNRKQISNPHPYPTLKPPPRPDIQRLVLRMLPPGPSLILILDPYPYEYPSPSSSSSWCGCGPARLRSDADAAGEGLGGIWVLGVGLVWDDTTKKILTGRESGERNNRTRRRKEIIKDASGKEGIKEERNGTKKGNGEWVSSRKKERLRTGEKKSGSACKKRRRE